MSRSYNIVVVSDLHLGEDLAPDASDQTMRDVEMAAAAAADFLSHLTQRRVDGLPWRLVGNGDVFDFLGLPERMPSDGAAHVDAIALRHPRFFRAMARFLASGNAIDIVAGNHDREIAHPEVAARVRAAVAAHGGPLEHLAFHEWFVHEPGVAWIEHGHQYDETCSFEHGLAPADPRGEIIPNLDAASARWLGPVAAVSPHATEEWTFGGYLRFAASLGARRAVRLFAGYARFIGAVWRASRLQESVRGRRERGRQHEARLAAIAAERGLAPATLRAIDDLRRLPITRSMRRVCKLLLLDRIAIALLAIVAMLGTAAWGGWPLGFLGAGAIAAALYGMDRAYRRRVPRDATVPLATVPARIHAATGVPVVVFGHTHVAMRLPLSGGAVYLNGGTWLPAIRPGLLRAFTHVVILRGKSGPEVHLRQWRDGSSRPFDETKSRITPPEGLPAVPAAA